MTGRVIQERDTTGNRQTTEVKGKAGGRKPRGDRRTERRRRKARALNDSIEMGQECGEVEREARTKGGKRTLGNGHQDARMQCLTQVVFPI